MEEQLSVASLEELRDAKKPVYRGALLGTQPLAVFVNFEHDKKYKYMPQPDDESPAPPARLGAMSANAGVKGEFALAGFEITMQGAVGGAVRYEFARKGASGGAGEVESY